MANEQKNKSIGEVKIAADVVAAIAGLAATEVDGVYAMAGTLTNELAGMLGKKKLTKGVKVQMELGVVHVDMMISCLLYTSTIVIALPHFVFIVISKFCCL